MEDLTNGYTFKNISGIGEEFHRNIIDIEPVNEKRTV